MFRNNTPARPTNRAVTPVFGVILMVAVTIALSAIIGVILLFGGMTIIGPHLDLTPYLPHLLALYIIGVTIDMYRKRRKQQAVTLTDCIEFSEDYIPITDDDTEDNEIHIVKATIETPANATLDTPLTVAPKHANPRNWSLTTRLTTNNEVTFVTNTDTIPKEIKTNDTIITPNNLHGKLNGQYKSGEIDALTIYDAHLNKVTTYKLKKH